MPEKLMSERLMPQLAVRLTISEHEALSRLAAEQDRSLSSAARLLLREAMASRARPRPAPERKQGRNKK